LLRGLRLAVDVRRLAELLLPVTRDRRQGLLCSSGGNPAPLGWSRTPGYGQFGPEQPDTAGNRADADGGGETLYCDQ